MRFNSVWKNAIYELLQSGNSFIRKEWLNSEEIDQIIDDHLSHKKSNMSVIMRLMSGEIFLRIEAIEWFIPISPILELIRFSTDVIILDNVDIYKNFTVIIVQSFCFIALGLLILNISLKKAFKEGRISLY